jgi:hypothetical protein
VHDVSHSNKQLIGEKQPQSGELIAHGRLLNTQQRSCLRDAPVLHEGVEGDQKVQVERPEIEVVDRLRASGT